MEIELESFYYYNMGWDRILSACLCASKSARQLNGTAVSVTASCPR